MKRAARAVAMLATLFVSAATVAETDGAAIYERCLACHTLAHDAVGPRHCGVVGRRAGSVPGFAYSQPMRDSRLTWDETTLDRFLAAPRDVVPGTLMTYAGVPDAAERHALIAWLRRAAGDPALCPGAATAAGGD